MKILPALFTIFKLLFSWWSLSLAAVNSAYSPVSWKSCFWLFPFLPHVSVKGWTWSCFLLHWDSSTPAHLEFPFTEVLVMGPAEVRPSPALGSKRCFHLCHFDEKKWNTSLKMFPLSLKEAEHLLLCAYLYIKHTYTRMHTYTARRAPPSHLVKQVNMQDAPWCLTQ